MASSQTLRRATNALNSVANLGVQISQYAQKLDAAYDTKIGNGASITMQNGLTDIFKDVDDTKWEERINKYRDEQWIQDVVALTGLDEKRVQRYFDKNHDSLYGAFNYSAERAAKAGYQALADTQYDADMNLQASKTNVNFRGLIGSARALDVQNEGLYDEDHRENWTDIDKISGLLQTNGALRLRDAADKAIASGTGDREEFIKQYGSEGLLGAEYEDAMNVIFKSAEYQTRSNALDEEGQKEYLGVVKESKLWDGLAGEAWVEALKEFQGKVDDELDAYETAYKHNAYLNGGLSDYTYSDLAEYLGEQGYDAYNNPIVMARAVEKNPGLREVCEQTSAKRGAKIQTQTIDIVTAQGGKWMEEADKNAKERETNKEAELYSYKNKAGEAIPINSWSTGQVWAFGPEGWTRIESNDNNLLSPSCQGFLTIQEAASFGKGDNVIYTWYPGVAEAVWEELGLESVGEKALAISSVNAQIASMDFGKGGSSSSASSATKSTNLVSDKAIYLSEQYSLGNISDDDFVPEVQEAMNNEEISFGEAGILISQANSTKTTDPTWLEKAGKVADDAGKAYFASNKKRTFQNFKDELNYNNILLPALAEWLKDNPKATPEQQLAYATSLIENYETGKATESLSKAYKTMKKPLSGKESITEIDMLESDATTVINCILQGEDPFFETYRDVVATARLGMMSGDESYSTVKKARDTMAPQVFGKEYDDLTDTQKCAIDGLVMGSMYLAVESKDVKWLAEKFSGGTEVREVFYDDGHIGYATASGYLIRRGFDKNSWFISYPGKDDADFMAAYSGEAQYSMYKFFVKNGGGENYATYSPGVTSGVVTLPTVGAMMGYDKQNGTSFAQDWANEFNNGRMVSGRDDVNKVLPEYQQVKIGKLKKIEDITTEDVWNDTNFVSVLNKLSDIRTSRLGGQENGNAV